MTVTRKILAGDIGGTNTRLALYEAGPVPRLIHEKIDKSATHKSLEEAVQTYLQEQETTVKAACFGVAGAVRGGVSHLTNLGWTVDSASLRRCLGTDFVHVCNDLEAVALALNFLQPADLLTINAGVASSAGTKAVIAAGTGLGQASVWSDGQTSHVLASEGGHASLGAIDQRQLGLLTYLLERGIETSWETVLSGAGIVRIYEYLAWAAAGDTASSAERWLTELKASGQNVAAGITGRALAPTAPTKEKDLCVAALEMFVQFYGQQAGNLALTVLATGGVFIAGGIAPKIQSLLIANDAFKKAFVRGRQSALLSDMPVHLITHSNPGMLGAASFASLNC